MFTGEYVRRAAANVSSTVGSVASSVAAVAHFGRDSDDEYNSDEAPSSGANGAGNPNGRQLINNLLPTRTTTSKAVSLSVKGSPPKDATSMAALAVKSGFLWKRNEQKQWQRRFVCLVPHTFLYYYENETSESPRGIIDCESYTDIAPVALSGNNTPADHTGEGHRVLRMAPSKSVRQQLGDGSSLRSFWFDGSIEELQEWATSLSRERYFIATEERAQYSAMLTALSGEFGPAGLQQAALAAEAEKLTAALERSEALVRDGSRAIQRALAVIGVADEEMETLTGGGIGVLGDALCEKLRATLSAHTATTASLAATIRSEAAIHAAELAAQAAEEKSLYEAAALAREQALREELAASKSEIEALRSVAATASAEQTKLTERLAIATEGKKVLAREVKSQRAAAAEMTSKVVEPLEKRIQELSETNNQLLDRISSLQNQLAALQTNPSSKFELEVATSIPPPPVTSPQTSTTTISPTQTKESAPSSAQNTSNRRNSLFGGLFGDDSNKTTTATNPPPSTGTSSTPQKRHSLVGLFHRNDDAHASSTEEGSRLTSFFSKDKEKSTAPHTDCAATTVTATDKTRLLCLHCGGTVEGPKYSTCRCPVPLLPGVDPAVHAAALESASSSNSGFFSDMFSRGSRFLKDHRDQQDDTNREGDVLLNVALNQHDTSSSSTTSPKPVAGVLDDAILSSSDIPS